MPFEVTNRRNDGKFIVADGETVLDAALRDKRVFPYGCRNGVCGACKSTLLAGRVDYGKFESSALTDDEIAQGKVLLCQAKPREDLIIDVQEVAGGADVQIKMLPCRVARIDKLAADVIRLFLQTPKSQQFNFNPGQYIDIVMKDGKRRSFSLANLPAQAVEDGLELHIRRVSDGRFTNLVFDAMRARDLLRFEGPFGAYLFQSAPDCEVVMVAGGTGFSPIKGLILHALAENPAQKIHLFWGARDRQDLYLNDLAEQWARDYQNFSYTPVLSEPRGGEWQGATGWVHEAVLNVYDNFADIDVYASGPPVMVDAVRDGLSAKGMAVERFFFDSFTHAPRE